MDAIIVTVYLQARDPETRPKIIDYLTSNANHAWANETGVLRYCVCKPYENDDGVSVYIIEQYANQDAMHSFGQSQPVMAFNKAISPDSGDSLLAVEPVVYKDKVALSTGEISSFTRKTVDDYPTAYIVLASLQYQPGLVTAALPGWKDIVSYCEANESLALTYTILEDTEKDVLRTVEAYESKTYAREVHVPGPAVKANQEQNGHMRAGTMNVKRGAKVAGFLIRP